MAKGPAFKVKSAFTFTMFELLMFTEPYIVSYSFYDGWYKKYVETIVAACLFLFSAEKTLYFLYKLYKYKIYLL